MKLTLISHFYNEEYLLPWWLKHHKNIFDHGVLINYHSTDKSVEIIKEICPEWELINTRNSDFDAALVDSEVMDIENSIEGYKICLNTTEFLVGEDIKSQLKNEGLNCYSINRITVVDNNPEDKISHEDNLLERKNFVNLKSPFTDSSVRYIHNHPSGKYHTGRHGNSLDSSTTLSSVWVLWYGFSPWTEKTIKRKLQIRERIPEGDKNCGKGWHHFIEVEELENYRKQLIETGLYFNNLK